MTNGCGGGRPHVDGGRKTHSPLAYVNLDDNVSTYLMLTAGGAASGELTSMIKPGRALSRRAMPAAWPSASSGRGLRAFGVVCALSGGDPVRSTQAMGWFIYRQSTTQSGLWRGRRGDPAGHRRHHPAHGRRPMLGGIVTSTGTAEGRLPS